VTQNLNAEGWPVQMSSDEMPVEITEAMNRAELLKRLGAGVAVASFVAPTFASAAFARSTGSTKPPPGSPASSAAPAPSSSGSTSRDALDHFNLTVPKGAVAVGTPFSIRIVAIDGSGDKLTTFSGTPTLSDETGTLSYDPDSINWVNGVATVTAQVGESVRHDAITVSYAGASSTVGSFAVVGSVSGAGLRVPRTVNADEPFTVRARAVDGAGNTVTNFNGPAVLTDTTGTLVVQDTNWTDGIGLFTVTVSEPHTGDQVTVTLGDPGVSVVSRKIIVFGALSAFSIAVPRSVSTYSSFLVRITALDDAGNKLVAYNGPVTLTDQSGDLDYDPGSIVWTNSHASVTAEIDERGDGTTTDQITVSDPGGVSSTSARFRVVGSNSSSSASRHI
jgi:hypothetical protein